MIELMYIADVTEEDGLFYDIFTISNNNGKKNCVTMRDRSPQLRIIACTTRTQGFICGDKYY